MKRLLVTCLLITGCATVRDELLPTVGTVLNHAHTAQAATVDARAASKVAVDFVCRQPLPETEKVCSEAQRALVVSLDALIISADGLDAASKGYTEVNEAVKK